MNKQTIKPTHFQCTFDANLRTLNIYCDGAAPNNQTFCWRGGFGVVAYDVHGVVVYEYSMPVIENGGTTSARTELLGLVHALELSHGNDVIHCDSKYCVDGYNQWLEGWKRKGWRKADKKTIAHPDLWQYVDELKAKRPDVTVCYVKGHSGAKGNERADELATMAAQGV